MRNLSSGVAGSGWPSLAARGEGHEVMAAQYGLDPREGDVATVRRTLGRVSSPHPGRPLLRRKRDYGRGDRVVGVVYLAALGPRRRRNTGTASAYIHRTDGVRLVMPRMGRMKRGRRA
jgi:hypothetical protein